MIVTSVSVSPYEACFLDSVGHFILLTLILLLQSFFPFFCGVPQAPSSVCLSVSASVPIICQMKHI